MNKPSGCKNNLQCKKKKPTNLNPLSKFKILNMRKVKS